MDVLQLFNVSLLNLIFLPLYSVLEAMEEEEISFLMSMFSFCCNVLTLSHIQHICSRQLYTYLGKNMEKLSSESMIIEELNTLLCHLRSMVGTWGLLFFLSGVCLSVCHTFSSHFLAHLCTKCKVSYWDHILSGVRPSCVVNI